MLHANIDEKVDELDDNNKKNVRLCFSSIEMELNGLNKSTNRASKNIRCVRDKLLQFTSRIREYQYFAKSSVCLGSVEPIELRKNMLMISWSESFLYGFCLFVLSCTHFYAFVICFFSLRRYSLGVVLNAYTHTYRSENTCKMMRVELVYHLNSILQCAKKPWNFDGKKREDESRYFELNSLTRAVWCLW